MAALEWRVISELMRAKDMIAIHQLGFNAEHLSGEPEAAQIFDYIRKWYHHPDTPREFPTIQSIQRQWPSFKMTGATTDKGSLRTLLKDCKGLSIDADIRALADYFYEMVADDPQEAIAIMQTHLSRISYQSQSTTGFSVGEIARDVRDHYEGAMTGAIYGIPWPWEPLTMDTLGKNSEDFIVMYGRMKSMKTWILLVNAMNDYLVNKRRVLVWSREMNRQKMALRAGSILGKVDYQCLKDGSLPSPLYDRAIMAIEAMAAIHDRSMKALEDIKKDNYTVKDVNDLLVVSGRGAPMTLEGLDGVVQSFAPDIVYLDSMYHLSCAEGLKSRSVPEKQRALAIGAKQMAINWGIPVVATVQANREGEKTHGETMIDVGWTDSLAQEADCIIRILYREGHAPHEDEYEGYWKELEKKMAQPSGAVKKRAGRMSLGMSEKAKKQFSRTARIPTKTRNKFDRLPKKKRKAAELFLMMGGNREGTLDGISIRCIPGYTWDVTRENVSPAEAKKLFGGDKKGKKGDGTAEAGGGFGDLK